MLTGNLDFKRVGLRACFIDIAKGLEVLEQFMQCGPKSYRVCLSNLSLDKWDLFFDSFH